MAKNNKIKQKFLIHFCKVNNRRNPYGFLLLYAICYRQISSLDVPLYAFGLSLKIRQAYFEFDLTIPSNFSISLCCVKILVKIKFLWYNIWAKHFKNTSHGENNLGKRCFLSLSYPCDGDKMFGDIEETLFRAFLRERIF